MNAPEESLDATANGDRRVAVVTGGSRDTGRDIAVALARLGLRVVLLHSPFSADAAAAALADLRMIDPGSAAREADVADERVVRTVFDQVVEEQGRIDLVVNGVGFLLTGAVGELDLDDVDRLHRTVVRGALIVSREAARVMGPGGVIVHLSTTLIGARVPGTSAVVAARAAVEAMTAVHAKELEARGIVAMTIPVSPTPAELRRLSRFGADALPDPSSVPDSVAAVVALAERRTRDAGGPADGSAR